jgi:uncharacterized protein (TIGR02145 family)
MKRTIFYLTFFLSFFFILNSCEKEDESYDPLELTYSKTDVSTYGAMDGRISVSIYGGKIPYTYSWSNGASTPSIEGLAIGEYTVTVNDNSDLSISETIEIAQPNPSAIVISLIVTNVTTYNGSDGAIDMTVSGGVEPYTFIWSNGAITEDIGSLPAGDYTITVSDDYGQTESSSETVGQPQPGEISISYTKEDVTEYGGSDGSIDITVSNGVPPYTYSWSNGESTEDINNLIAGTYTVTVTDSEAQTKTETISIIEPEQTTVTDIDGNVYEIVQVGTQIWMAENLKVTKNPAGESIESLIYDDDETNLESYGRLYDWETSNEVCPNGWHLPTDDEWNILIDELGGAAVAGGKMKETGTTYWNSPNTGATNESGMSIRAAGEKDEVEYRLIREYAVYWTATSVSSVDAKEKYLSYNSAAVSDYDWHKVLYYSVRCVKDN